MAKIPPKMIPIIKTKNIPPTLMRFKAETPEELFSSSYEQSKKNTLEKKKHCNFFLQILTEQVPPPLSLFHHLFFKFAINPFSFS